MELPSSKATLARLPIGKGVHPMEAFLPTSRGVGLLSAGALCPGPIEGN